MNLAKLQWVTYLVIGLSVAMSEACAGASMAHSPYLQMAPLGRYFIADRNAEIALARSAAPPSISRDATVLVLGRHGYETARGGKNGFTCLVERAWMSPFDSPEFWNAKIRGPICYNAPASRSILRYTFERTELAMAGFSRIRMIDRIGALLAEKKLPWPETGSMSYMMSKNQYLGDSAGPWHPHLMFHVLKQKGDGSGASWGADLPGSPVLLNTQYERVPEPETIFMIAVAKWSDGTAAPSMKH